jgi:hypothetical protein
LRARLVVFPNGGHLAGKESLERDSNLSLVGIVQQPTVPIAQPIQDGYRVRADVFRRDRDAVPMEHVQMGLGLIDGRIGQLASIGRRGETQQSE